MTPIGFAPTKKFKEWAMSFSGCTGGDLNKGGIWFSGIEYGGRIKEGDDFLLNKYDDMPILEWSVVERDFKYQFNKKIAKLFTVIKGENVSDYRRVAKIFKMLCKGSNTLKLNLYPLQFPGDKDQLWEKWIYEKSGLISKNIYKVWCQEYRFPMFHKMVSDYSPRVVVCSGLQTKDAFLMAFCGVENIHEIKEGEKEIKITNGKVEKRFFCYEINEGLTLLVITPFWGWRKYELNNDADIQEVGDWIKKKIDTMAHI